MPGVLTRSHIHMKSGVRRTVMFNKKIIGVYLVTIHFFTLLAVVDPIACTISSTCMPTPFISWLCKEDWSCYVVVLCCTLLKFWMPQVAYQVIKGGRCSCCFVSFSLNALYTFICAMGAAQVWYELWRLPLSPMSTPENLCCLKTHRGITNNMRV